MNENSFVQGFVDELEKDAGLKKLLASSLIAGSALVGGASHLHAPAARPMALESVKRHYPFVRGVPESVKELPGGRSLQIESNVYDWEVRRPRKVVQKVLKAKPEAPHPRPEDYHMGSEDDPRRHVMLENIMGLRAQQGLKQHPLTELLEKERLLRRGKAESW